MMTIVYTEEIVIKTYRLDEKDTQTLLDRIEKLKQRKGYNDFLDKELVIRQACCDLVEEDKIAPILINEDSEGEEITGVDIYKK